MPRLPVKSAPAPGSGCLHSHYWLPQFPATTASNHGIASLKSRYNTILPALATALATICGGAVYP